MINPKTVHGKKLALIGWAKDEKGEDDVSVFSGIAKWNGTQLTLDRGDDNLEFNVPDDWLGRLKIVEDELKETLMNADYAISFSVGNLPEGKASEYILTTLKWPKENL